MPMDFLDYSLFSVAVCGLWKVEIGTWSIEIYQETYQKTYGLNSGILLYLCKSFNQMTFRNAPLHVLYKITFFRTKLVHKIFPAKKAPFFRKMRSSGWKSSPFFLYFEVVAFPSKCTPFSLKFWISSPCRSSPNPAPREEACRESV